MTPQTTNGSFSPRQLHDYDHWREALGKDQVGFWDYLGARADFELAAAFAKLFWPDLIEVEGHVFLAEHFAESEFRQWQQSAKERRAIELVINELHIYDLFLADDHGKFDPALFSYLRRVLAESWSCALQRSFPTRQFEFHYGDEPHSYGPTLTFCQKPEGNS